MIQRAAGVLAGGAWCLVGGAIEPHESQPDAVCREFFEEIGGRVRAIERLWQYDRPDGGLRLYWWRCELLDDALTPNPAEVQDWRWCTLAEALALPRLLDSNRTFLSQLGERIAHDGT